jgi:hypothetical protein
MGILYIICFVGVVLLSFVLVASERDLRSRRRNLFNDEWGEYPESSIRLKERLRQHYRRRLRFTENRPTNVVEFSQTKQAR